MISECSFLSSEAKGLFKLCQSSKLTCTCVDENGILNGDIIQAHLKDYVDKNDFKNSVLSIAHTFSECSKKISQLTEMQILKQHAISIEWLYTPSEFETLLHLAFEDIQANSIFIILRLSAVFEFSLAQLVKNANNQCPNNMISSLNNPLLADKITKPFVDVLKIVFGPVDSLNIRNLFWHGFVSIEDCKSVIPSSLVYFLFSLAISIGQQLYREKSDSKFNPNNSLLECTCKKLQQMFTSDVEHTNLTLIPLLNSYVNNNTIITAYGNLIDILRSQTSPRYQDALCLSIICINVIIREEFCKINRWPEGNYSSNKRYFLTLDSILQVRMHKIYDKTIPFSNWQQLSDIVGPQFLTLLSGMLSSLEGPRLRERLSHGQLYVSEENSETEEVFWHPMSNIVYHCLAYLLARINGNIKLVLTHGLDIDFSNSDCYHSLSQYICKVWRFSVQFQNLQMHISKNFPNFQNSSSHARVIDKLLTWFPDKQINLNVDNLEAMNASLPVIDVQLLWLWKVYVAMSSANSRYEAKQPFRTVTHLLNILKKLDFITTTLSELASDVFRHKECKNVRSKRFTNERFISIFPMLVSYLQLYLVCFTRGLIWQTWLAGDFFAASTPEALSLFVLHNPKYQLPVSSAKLMYKLEALLDKLISAIINYDWLEVKKVLELFESL